MKLKRTIVALTLAISNIFAAMLFIPTVSAAEAANTVPDFDSVAASMVIMDDFQGYRPYQRPNFPAESTGTVSNTSDGNKEYFVHGTKPTMLSSIPTYAVNVEADGNQYLEWKYGTTLFRQSRLHINIEAEEQAALKSTAYVMEISLKMGENFGNFAEYFYLFDNRSASGAVWRALAVNKSGIIYQGDFSGGVSENAKKIVGKISRDKWTRISIAVNAEGKASVYIDGKKTAGADVWGALSPKRITPISMLSTMDREVDLCIDNCAVYKSTSIAPAKATSYSTPEPYMIGANLTLGSDIDLNFYLPAATVKGLENLKVVGIMRGESRELLLKGSKDIDGIDCKVYSYTNITPDMMVESITVRTSADGHKGSELSYSVGDYFHNVLDREGAKTYSSPESKKLQAMCVEALNYGASMQKLNKYRTYEPVNHGISVRQRDMLADSTPEIKNNMQIFNAADGVEWYGAALDLSDSVKLKFYFISPSTPTTEAVIKCRGISEMKVSPGSFEKLSAEGQELYCITFDAKNILNLCDDVTVTIGDSNITYGVKHCDDAAYTEVVTALARYISSVKDYRDIIAE